MKLINLERNRVDSYRYQESKLDRPQSFNKEDTICTILKELYNVNSDIKFKGFFPNIEIKSYGDMDMLDLNIDGKFYDRINYKQAIELILKAFYG